jgi:hypothetical protein
MAMMCIYVYFAHFPAHPKVRLRERGNAGLPDLVGTREHYGSPRGHQSLQKSISRARSFEREKRSGVTYGPLEVDGGNNVLLAHDNFATLMTAQPRPHSVS